MFTKIPLARYQIRLISGPVSVFFQNDIRGLWYNTQITYKVGCGVVHNILYILMYKKEIIL